MDISSVQVLLQSLVKKNQTLDRLIELNTVHENLLKADELDMDALDAMLDEQGELVEELGLLDDGFEAVYDRCREELIANKEQYREEIRGMQECISQITSKIATLNAGNMRNKMLAENQFKRQKQEISQNLSKTNVARNYYNSMNKLNYVTPQFYDNKK